MRGLCVPFIVLRRMSERKGLANHAPSFLRTTSLIVRPSTARPASLGITAFMTFPRSLADVAPVSAMASATAWSISAGSTGGGR